LLDGKADAKATGDTTACATVGPSTTPLAECRERLRSG
jgi:hypothetical protein